MKTQKKKAAYLTNIAVSITLGLSDSEGFLYTGNTFEYILERISSNTSDNCSCFSTLVCMNI